MLCFWAFGWEAAKSWPPGASLEENGFDDVLTSERESNTVVLLVREIHQSAFGRIWNPSLELRIPKHQVHFEFSQIFRESPH